MCKLSNGQYFLIIPEINLFPELNNNSIEIMGQIFNAILLCKRSNLQYFIDAIVDLEKQYKLFHLNNHIDLINQISPLI